MSLAGNIAATGLTAAQQRIDTIAQNLANIKTTAYQKMILAVFITFSTFKSTYISR